MKRVAFGSFAVTQQPERCHGDLLKIFRRAVRSVMTMCRVCRIFMSHSNFSCGMQLNMLENFNQQSSTGKTLVFDLNYFKVKKNHIPQKLVEIMWHHPEHRAEPDVLLLQSLMSTMDGFRRYSPPLQLLLSRIVRYQRLERRRVVVKRGDLGHSFYFVFSGQVAVTMDTDGSSAFVDKEPILIKKGMSFGDVALIKGVRRNATVVCVEETELMVIDKEDFFANKMDVELKREFLYRFNFFRSLELVSSWSNTLIERLADRSKAEQFRYGHIIVRDTNDMGNLMFIAQGLCDVFREVDLTKCKAYQRLLKHQKKAEVRARHALQKQQGGAVSHRISTQRVSPNHMKAPVGDDTSAWFLIDTLTQGSTFGLNEYLIPQRQRDGRSLTLVSHSVEVLRVEKTCFDELVDKETLTKLKDVQKTYPSDEELCDVMLRHRRWEEFKQGVVMDVMNHFKRRDIGDITAYWDVTTNSKSPVKATATSGKST
ncbi:cyclic nucleotide-binding domain-containing protein 2-like [Engraulis encrasicolus]|uniref:cyclic nucleotide-binding domain-containing protein 2-like n=1 Tax=Engraulis encrasicolus TaxID=184585 RepID=UPI002FD56298